MTAGWGTLMRVGALVLLTVVIQLAVVSQVTILGSDADLIPLVAVSAGLLAGPIGGATTGFLLGLVVDMALLQTLGVSSLLLTGIGYGAGRYRELRDASHKLVPPLAGALGTLAYSISFSVTQFLLGVESPVSPLVIRDIIVGAILNGLIAAPVFSLVRRLLGRSLVDDLRPRRRPIRRAVRLTGQAGSGLGA